MVAAEARPRPLMKPAQASRLAAGALLATVEAARGDHPLLDWLILTAIARRPGPASIATVAAVLRLSPEAMGRRLARLQRRGCCTLVPAGVEVCHAGLGAPGAMAQAFVAYEQVRQLYYRLRDLELWRSPAPARDIPGDAPPDAKVMAVFVRLLGDYVLRSVDAATPPGGDVEAQLMLLAILRANTWHLAENGDFAPDALRRPAAIDSLTERLGVPTVTARRLLAEGRCALQGRGLVAPADLLAQPAWTRFTSASLYGLTQMLSGLDDLGVLADWEARRA
jgi:DNA-binding Lrp family transcriptional regulator